MRILHRKRGERGREDVRRETERERERERDDIIAQ